MTKPFSLEELVARIRTILRRTGAAAPESAGSCSRTSSWTRSPARSGGPVSAIELTATEYRLLRYLMLNPRRVMTRAQLLDHVWDYDFGGDGRVLETYISYLRKKLDAHRPVADPHRPRRRLRHAGTRAVDLLAARPPAGRRAAAVGRRPGAARRGHLCRAALLPRGPRRPGAEPRSRRSRRHWTTKDFARRAPSRARPCNRAMGGSVPAGCPGRGPGINLPPGTLRAAPGRFGKRDRTPRGDQIQPERKRPCHAQTPGAGAR